jgi:glycogen synthase
VRVLTVTNLYPPAYAGGYELICRGVVERLRADGHAVRILVGDPPVDPALRDDPDVHRALHVYWRGESAVVLSPFDRLRLERANRVILRRHLRDFSPDVVSWWGMGGMSLSLIEQVRRARIPAVAFICDNWFDYAPVTDAWTRMFAGHRTLGRAVDFLTGLPTRVDWDGAAGYVFLSEYLRRESPPLRRTVVENPGIDAEFQTARPVRPWADRLLTLGRMDPRKGFATAIEALASLPEATLTIAGGGPKTEISRLREVASGYGVGERVTWLGPQERAVLPDLYAAHDVVLFPVVWEEPFGLVPLEAMGIGRPVIATGRGGSGEYLRDGENCLLHPAQDAAALADAVRRLGGDEALRSRLREGGLVTASQLTSERYERAAVDHLRAAISTGCR